MVVSRVPTHNTQNGYISRAMQVQSRIASLSYSVTTGQKSFNYSGISRQTLSLLNYETQKTRTIQFKENNLNTQVKLGVVSKSLETIQKTATDFRSSLRSLLEIDLSNITPDYYSTPPKTINEDTMKQIRNVQQQAFDALKQIEDALNSQANGDYLFSGGKTGTSPVNFPFSNLEEFQKYYDGLFVTYPTTGAADLSDIKTGDDITGGFTLTQDITRIGYDANGNPVAVPGNFVFSYEDNKITANPGTFSNIKPGGLVSLTGTQPNGLNDGDYIVSSVSDDGSTVRFETLTSLKAPEIPTYVGGMNGANPVTMTIDNGTVPMPVVDFSADNNDITFDAKGNKIVAKNSYTFSGLKAGDKITLGNTSTDPYGSGIVNNDRTFEIVSVSEDGSEVVLKEAINLPNIPNGEMTGAAGDLTITQDMEIGYIDAMNPNGITISSINTGGNNAVFNGNTMTVNPADLPKFFANVKAGGTIDISGSAAGNNGTFYVKDVNLVTGEITIDGTFNAETQNNIGIDIKSLEHGFVSENILGGSSTTGSLFFNTAKNQITAENANAFSTFKPGDSIVLHGTANNNGIKYIKSVSEDGKTITFSDETPIVAEGTPIDPPFNQYTKITNGTGVNFGKTYPIGSTISLDNISPAYNGEYTIVGVSEDGNRLIVKTDKFPRSPLTAPSIDFPATGKSSVGSTSYYKGDKLEIKTRVDENTVLDTGVNASNGAFEKVIRALGMIAQGNFVDTRDPLKAKDGVNVNQALDRVNEAISLLDDALSHDSIKNPDESRSDLAQLNYRMGYNSANVKNIIESQTYMIKSLETNVDNIEKMDKAEASALLLEQVTTLEYSFSIMATVSKLSLLNYL